VSAQTVGIILSIFSVLCSALIYWGGFKEEQRATADTEAARPKG
jgi:hypothetical protein